MAWNRRQIKRGALGGPKKYSPSLSPPQPFDFSTTGGGGHLPGVHDTHAVGALLLGLVVAPEEHLPLHPRAHHPPSHDIHDGGGGNTEMVQSWRNSENSKIDYWPTFLGKIKMKQSENMPCVALPSACPELRGDRGRDSLELAVGGGEEAAVEGRVVVQVVVDGLHELRDLARHPAGGGGSAWLVGGRCGRGGGVTKGGEATSPGGGKGAAGKMRRKIAETYMSIQGGAVTEMRVLFVRLVYRSRQP